MTALTFFHSPNTRSTGARILLEELGAPYTLHALNMKAGEQRGAAYLAINPMGKVPAIGDPLRGPYLRWMAFYGSCFEPALVDKALKRDAASPAMLPYGDYDTTVKTVNDQLAKGPYILGEKFTAADVLWGTALQWTTMFGLIPATPDIAAYIERVTSRPAAKRVREMDAALTAEHEAAAAK